MSLSSKNPLQYHSIRFQNACLLQKDGSITKGSLRIENGILSDPHRSAEVEIDAGGYLITPGWTNSHTHVAMGFFRGLTYGATDMIENIFYPAERALKKEWMKALSWSYLYAGLRSGVTCFVDHYYGSHGVADAMETLGVRGVVGETIADINSVFDGQQSWKQARSEIESWEYSRVKPSLAPHAADTVSKKLMSEIGAYATSQNIPIHLHLSQTDGERERVQQREGVSPVEYAQKCGVLTPHTLAVHLVSATQKDLKILHDQGTSAGFCPSSQLLYDEMSPIKDIWEQNLKISLGTDCAACNDHGDLLSEMRFASLILRDRKIQHSAKDIFQMVTTAPQSVFNLPSCQLVEGNVADLVFMKLDLDTLPLTSSGENLLYSFQSRHVQHVMVDGEWVLWDTLPVKISRSHMQEEYENTVKKIKHASKLEKHGAIL